MSAGTLTLTNNSAAVTGSGTAFTTELAVGDFIVVTVGGIPYTLAIKTVNSNTSLTLVSNYTGPTQGGAAWYAVPRVAMNLVTAALVAQSAEALRGLNYDKQNWQRLFSASGNITVTLPDGSSFTGPSWQYMVNTVATKTNGAVPVNQGGTGATTAEGGRTNLGLGSAATVDRQSSITDTTAGVALMQGAFGLGQAIPNQFPLGLPLDRTQFYGATQGNGSNPVAQRMGGVVLAYAGGSYACAIAAALDTTSPTIWFRGVAGGTAGSWQKFYTSTNTTVASDGTLKAASPVVKVFSDGAYQTNDESEGVKVTRLNVGQYLIEGCQALNSDAAWGGMDGGFDIPTDRNKQPLIWLDYEVNADGSVLVKTYHRTHPDAPAFAKNELDGLSDGDPVDIPADQFVSVRVEMPQNSIWNQRAATVEIPDSSAG
ncbi:phage tail protein [Enterobacter ludwigii]|uniref:phage tail fiber protein n=3 Tax=Enterobacter cloacae complex TaxID=354276 RepID=UPI00123BF7BB|nr:phage tail protein [Enterobacter ludwigii]MBS0871195.1 phage tail protein [Enterobacter ludwigii]